MKPSGLSIILLTIAIAVVVASGTTPAVAQDESVCSAMVTVVNEQGAALPAGYNISLMFSPVDLREQGTDGISKSFRFDSLPCGEALAVVGQGGGGAVEQRVLEAVVREPVSLEPGAPLEVHLTIPAMIPVTVVAVDENGAPAAGGNVIAIPGGDNRQNFGSAHYGSLSSTGEAVLQLQPGRYLLQTSFSDGQTVQSMTVDGATFNAKEPLLIGDRPRELLIVVSSAERITGIVTEDDGEPIPGYQLIVRKVVSVRDNQYTMLQEDGRFVVTTSEFPVEVFIHDPGGDWKFEPVSILVPDKEHANGLHFTGRHFEDRTLKGRVLAGDPAVPVARAFISSSPNCYTGDGKRSVARPVQIMADDDGEFELPCFDGCYISLEISKPRSEEYLPLEWYGGPEECEQEQTFILQEGNTVTGVVTDSQGDPVPDLVVGTMMMRNQAVTDGEGRYRIQSLDAGRYELQVMRPRDAAFNPWILMTEDSGKGPAVQFNSNGKTRELDLVVTRGGSICLDLGDGEGRSMGVDYLELFLSGEDNPAKASSRYDSTGMTRTDPFCLGPLAPGDYHLRAGNRFSSFMPTWWPGTDDREQATLVSVIAGDRLELGPMTTHRAGPVQVNIKEGHFLQSSPPFLAFRVAVERNDPEEEVEEQEWVQVDQDELRFLGETKTRTEAGQPTYRSLRYAPYPTGRYDVRLCETEDCEDGKVWCSPKPLVVEKKNGGEIELVLSEDSECRAISDDEVDLPNEKSGPNR
ncbi:MAG: carboxypeptidase regulatory-like domain-containing protein [Acidobacteria bacterium]|uniref:Carboxypeptidase regulatory-like domain-containing protein n=1 Tax=Candidatus Polarisedimenticola svalbardensis TaxID=2886004 RepID=A0A8J7C2Q2_9BACT|nr:carboxypeptidase regulatory-like domain-containing protein [Candidatus Polarisedimenticola svalbardensis]